MEINNEIGNEINKADSNKFLKPKSIKLDSSVLPAMGLCIELSDIIKNLEEAVVIAQVKKIKIDNES